MLDSDPILGKIVGIYPSDRARLLLPAVLISGVVAVILNFTIATIPDWWGPALTTILMSLVVLVVGWRVLHFWNREVVLYDKGFSYREGARTVLFLYHEVVTIRQSGQQLAYFGGLIRRNTLQFTLIALHGETMILNSLYKRVDTLGAQIEAKVYPLLEPQLTQRMAQGEKISFSASLRLSSQGLHEKGRDLLWAQYGGYQVGGGQLRLLALPDKSEWFSLPLPDVDNLPLLVKLLKQHQKVLIVPV
ncbi:MAG: DUF6585 family protein [Anaerolineae bacterium]